MVLYLFKILKIINFYLKSTVNNRFDIFNVNVFDVINFLIIFKFSLIIYILFQFNFINYKPQK